MLNSKKLFAIVFFAIFLLACVLRLYKLEAVPYGFHIDEASLGYNAYSLLLTGKDDNGNSFPLYIDIFGDQRPAGYHYLATIPVKIFGLSEFSTRLPGALFGIASIFAIYFLTNVIFKNRIIATLSAFLLAISPWHVVLSRASAETIVALFFILTGFALVVMSIQKRGGAYLVLGSLSLAASFFFYHTPRVFVPFLFIVFALFSLNLYKKNKKYLNKMILSIILVGLVSFLLVFSIKGGSGRFNQVNIFGHPETKLVAEEYIREDGVSNISPFFSRFSHNKLISYSRTFVSNYFDYFDGKFLFMEGGLPVWYKVPGLGLIHLIELPFMLLGLYLLLRSGSVLYKLIPLWIITAPAVAALTVDDIPNIQRAIVLFPALHISSAFGIYEFYNRFKNLRKILIITLVIIFSYSTYYFLHQYFVHSKVHRPWYRNNGVRQMMETVKKSYDSYDSIIITKSTGGLYPLVLFYMKYDPQTYQKEGSPKDLDYRSFGKFLFVPQDCPSINRDSKFPKTKNTIFVDKGDCPHLPGQNSIMILREDKTPAYKIVYENF